MAKEKALEAAAQESAFLKRPVKLPPQAKPKPRILGKVPVRAVPRAEKKQARTVILFNSGMGYFKTVGRGDRGLERFLGRNFNLKPDNFGPAKYLRDEKRRIYMASVKLEGGKTGVLTLSVGSNEIEMALSDKKGNPKAFVYHGNGKLIYG